MVIKRIALELYHHERHHTGCTVQSKKILWESCCRHHPWSRLTPIIQVLKWKVATKSKERLHYFAFVLLFSRCLLPLLLLTPKINTMYFFFLPPTFPPSLTSPLTRCHCYCWTAFNGTYTRNCRSVLNYPLPLQSKTQPEETTAPSRVWPSTIYALF